MNRPDFSNYVAHFTKAGTPCVAQDDLSESDAQAMSASAYERQKSILTSKRIIATKMPWTGKKAVAFTECPFWSLLDHAERYSPYGIGFTKPHLFAADGGPAIYLRTDIHDKQNEFILKDFPHIHGFHRDVYAFVTPFIPEYAPQWMKDNWRRDDPERKLSDFTHEREWRVPHNFTFRLDQVEFVIVDTYEDMAKYPRELKDEIGRDKFVIMEMYRKIEELWPTHRIGREDG